MTPHISGPQDNAAPRTGLSPASSGGTSDQVGLLHGTVLLTQRGETEVQDLKPGDKVISRNAGMARLTGILQCHVRLHLISIAAGSLGHTRPERDMLVPAGQQILIRDWRAEAMFGKPAALVSAQDLVDGEFILDLGRRRQRVYHLQFDRPHVVYAGGLEVACGDWPAAKVRPAA